MVSFFFYDRLEAEGEEEVVVRTFLD